MQLVDYFKIIQKYFPVDSIAYSIYVPHVVLVTAKALEIARRLGLSEEQMRFIEEAGMLHDVGICRVNNPKLSCFGELPYICHIVEGKKILEAEGLLKHARVAESHTGVGIFKSDILVNKFLIPLKDYIPETLEEKIISLADIFFKKTPPKLWREQTMEEAREEIGQYGEDRLRIFDEWRDLFGE